MAPERDDEAIAETLPSSEEPADLALTRTAASGKQAAAQGVPVEGRQIGRYRLIEELGAGGMGRVYRALDPHLNREVAIKLLHPAAEGSDHAAELQRRLLREAQAMARLRHTNLAVVHDVGTDAGEVFLAMELIEGQTLKAWMKDGRPWRESLDVIIAAGRGLAAAHSAGVVHRDFKPDNVLIDGAGVAKVVDFGLARGVEDGDVLRRSSSAVARDDVLATPLTMTGATLGTPAYMAPEQHAGEVAGEAADQFSLAVTAYELLYGVRPFQGDTLARIAEQVARGEVPEPAPGPEVPASLWPVIRRALSVDPADRWPSIEAFLDALASPAPTTSVHWSWALVVAVLVTGGVYLGWRGLAGGGTERAAVADAAPAPLRGSIPREAIQRVVRENRDSVLACYDDAERADPDIGDGQVSIRFFVAETGHVRTVEVDRSRAPSPEVASCVAAASMSWKFPPPEGGGEVEVSYPFVFRKLSVEAMGKARFRVARRTVESLIEHPARIGARPVPAVKNGERYGVKVYAIQRGSIAARLGLENGDTVISIGDQPMPELDLDSLARYLAQATEVEVALTRKGEPVALFYEIVD